MSGSILSLRVILIASLCLMTVAHHILLINVLYDPSGSLDAANEAIVFMKDLKEHELECNKVLKCKLYMRKEAYAAMGGDLVKEMESLLNSAVNFYTIDPAVDRNIGSLQPKYEHVSEILSSIKDVTDSHKDYKDSTLLSLSFSSLSSPRFSPSFARLFSKVSSDSDSVQILLFEKTRELSSVSDWHDLMLLVLKLGHPGVQSWVNTFLDLYRYYAVRPTFTLLEPRPTLLEANVRTGGKVGVGYLSPTDICVLPLDSGSKFRMGSDHGGHSSFCSGPDDKASIKLHCGDGNVYASHVCATIHTPIGWKKAVRSLRHDITEKARANMQSILKEFPRKMMLGPNRYRFAEKSDFPLDFCWNTGNLSYETPTRSRIYHSLTDSRPYEKPAHRSGYTTLKQKITMISGSHGDAESLDNILPSTLSKMYYAHRHGYRYRHILSNQYVQFFGPRFLEDTPLGENHYGQAVMSKVPMILSQMFENPDSEWVFWNDDDMFINPGWLDLPLESFLEDVPEDKVVVVGNMRSAFSNAVFYRNSEEGRAFAIDWLAVAMSGYVQCHGFDQAALETVILSRMHDGRDIRTAIPFNHTCLNSKWATDTKKTSRVPKGLLDHVQKSPPLWDWGCDGGADWSCDFKYENSLTRLGFRSTSRNFHRGISSISKGCANEYIPALHVSYETEKRPRLHCSYCQDIDRIESGEFTYDGPLGSGNDWVRRDAVNSWFMNHKTLYTFFDSYTKPETCKKNDKFVPSCDRKAVQLVIENQEFDQEQTHSAHHTKRIVSLVDGYAYDLDEQIYCYGGNDLFKYQLSHTYMKEYSTLIAKSKQIPLNEWNEAYSKAAKIRKGTSHILESNYFEKENFCESCRKVYNPEYTGSRLGDGIVLDCRR